MYRSVLTARHRLLSVAMSEEEHQFIREQADLIKSSGVLGRSRSYRRLFDYLVENTLSGRAPKEIEIAAEVFSRDKSFDPTQDSMVRVYAHNLRQKIRQYYESEGRSEKRRLILPRGEYRLAVTQEQLADDDAELRRPATIALVGALAGVLLVGLAVDRYTNIRFRSAAFLVRFANARNPAPTVAVNTQHGMYGHVDRQLLPVDRRRQ